MFALLLTILSLLLILISLPFSLLWVVKVVQVCLAFCTQNLVELDRFRSETKCGTNVDHQAHLRAILPTTATGLPTTSATSTTGRTRSWRRAGTSGRERERPSQRRYRHLRGEVLGPRCAPTGTTPRSKPRCEPYNLLPYASASNVSDWPQLGCNQ